MVGPAGLLGVGVPGGSGLGAGGACRERSYGRSWPSLLALAATTRWPWARKEPSGSWVEAGQGSPRFCPESHLRLGGGGLETLSTSVSTVGWYRCPGVGKGLK